MSLSAVITNIARASLHDGPGVRTVVYLKGCGLRCAWCHNPETHADGPQILFAPMKCVHCGRCVALCPEHHFIRDGELVETEKYFVGQVEDEYSRAVFGMTGERHYLLMTINFDWKVAHTAKLADAARFLYDKGCVKAYALDGGQTAQLWMNGRLLNHIDWDTERPVSDILYFASAGWDA